MSRDRRIRIRRLAGYVCAVAALRGCGDSAVGGPSIVAASLPCDVGRALATYCQGCHGSAPLYGAPMPLVTWADMQAPLAGAPSRTVWQEMDARMHDPLRPMPPAQQPQVGADELAVLESWFAQGAPSGSGEACTPRDAGSAPTAAAGAGGDATCAPSHDFTAHAPGSRSAPFEVAPASESYVCFAFRSPFAAGTQATALVPRVGDASVLHHMNLYGTHDVVPDGSVGTCDSMDVLIADWDPGVTAEVLPPDVGLELDYTSYVLQVHYFNATGRDDVLDQSGIALCTATRSRGTTAGLVTLGTTAFAIPPRAEAHAITSRCARLVGNGSLYAIGTRPHMHALGRSFVTRHLRGGADLGNLVDVRAWSIDEQRSYALSPWRELAGDVLETVCTYANYGDSVVRYGDSASDEMCFNYLLVFPVSALGALDSARTCNEDQDE